jgi:hypothetical protein
MENIKILEKHFRKGMIHKNFDLFKKDYPTLLKCILGAMDEALSQHDVIKNEVVVCDYPWHDNEVSTIGGCTKCKEYKED